MKFTVIRQWVIELSYGNNWNTVKYIDFKKCIDFRYLGVSPGKLW